MLSAGRRPTRDTGRHRGRAIQRRRRGRGDGRWGDARKLAAEGQDARRSVGGSRSAAVVAAVDNAVFGSDRGRALDEKPMTIDLRIVYRALKRMPARIILCALWGTSERKPTPIVFGTACGRGGAGSDHPADAVGDVALRSIMLGGCVKHALRAKVDPALRSSTLSWRASW